MALKAVYGVSLCVRVRAYVYVALTCRKRKSRRETDVVNKKERKPERKKCILLV